MSRFWSSAGRGDRTDGSRGVLRARQRDWAGAAQRRRCRPSRQACRRRDPEDRWSVHLSGGTPGWAGPATQPTSVRILPPGVAHARGAPSAEEAAPCISRLRPPLPATTLPAQAGPCCLPGRPPTHQPTRTLPPGATPGLRPTAHAPPHRAARTGTRLGRRNDPGPRSGRTVRTGSRAGRSVRASPPFPRTTLGAVHSSRPSRAAPCPGRPIRTDCQPGRPVRPNPPIHSQAGNARCRHLRTRAGSCHHPQVRRRARPSPHPQEQFHRPEPQLCRHRDGPSNCRPRTPQ